MCGVKWRNRISQYIYMYMYICYDTGSRLVPLDFFTSLMYFVKIQSWVKIYNIIGLYQINQVKNEFPPTLTVDWPRADAAVPSVVDPYNISLLHDVRDIECKYVRDNADEVSIIWNNWTTRRREPGIRSFDRNLFIGVVFDFITNTLFNLDHGLKGDITRVNHWLNSCVSAVNFYK